MFLQQRHLSSLVKPTKNAFDLTNKQLEDDEQLLAGYGSWECGMCTSTVIFRLNPLDERKAYHPCKVYLPTLGLYFHGRCIGK